MSRPVPNPGILDIAPYTPGKSPVPEPGRKVFKLSANETPFGPSPKAMAVYKEAAAHLEDYPEGTSRVLREAIGRAFGLDPNRIICGAGSDEILNLLAHTYLCQGDEAISTVHGFLVYPIATMANGAKNVVAPETDFIANVDAVNRIRGPFNVSTPAMLAAVAAIEDTAHVQMSKAHTEKWRNWLTEEITKLGLKVTPSVANFVLIHFPLDKGKTSVDADAYLTKRGLVLRALNNYGLPHSLRMTIGTEEAT